MQFFYFASLAALAFPANAVIPKRRSPLHVGRRDLVQPGGPSIAPRDTVASLLPEPRPYQRPGKTVIPQNSNTTKFGIDGTKIPGINFDFGESYAGLLPVSQKKNETRQFYFWFVPSENPAAKDEITIWLNGGPGCSSLEGFFQENGPVIWQYGSYRPVKNPWTWANLTNVVWVEQPIGTGFTQGKSTEQNEDDVAETFLGWFKNFIDTFDLHDRKVYVTGESYAGSYVPYITNAMINKKDKVYYDAKGLLIYDPLLTYDAISNEIPALPFVEFHQNLFHLNDTFMADLRKRDRECGYADYRSKYFDKYPPPKDTADPPADTGKDTCALWTAIYGAVSYTNPCFDMYQVATTCPLLYDPLGFPGSFDYLPAGVNIFFNRTDVQKAINAPIQEWHECSNGVLRQDTSLPSALSVLPGLIDKLDRTLVGHAELDFTLLLNGTLFALNNMTWGGSRGFTGPPTTPLLVPYHSELSQETLAASGQMGVFRTERKLTFFNQWLSGHMVPQYAPSAAFRHVEFLLGRVPSLNSTAKFTTQR